MATTQNTESMPEQRDRSARGPAQPPAASPSALLSDLVVTLIFAGGAVACIAITAVIVFFNRPAPIEEFGKVGQQFYPQFTDPTRATSLGVYAFDAEAVRPLSFRVERLENGRWVIPSHHNYPAEAQERLAKTAASIIGIQRGAMVTRWEADHGRFGVVNPKQTSLEVEQIEGLGKRLVLGGEGDAVLADFIIGKQVEGGEKRYYVRRPDEEEVYIAELDLDLSAKFADWINTDLLELQGANIVEATINNYSIDEISGTINRPKASMFLRDSSSDPWKLEGLNETTEEVNADAMRETVDAVADLKIAGVRPKQKGLTPDLRLDRSALATQEDFELLQEDLFARGFRLLPGEQGSAGVLHLISREGELIAATDKGLRYRLYFGGAFTGSQEEIEIGTKTGGTKTGGTETTKDGAETEQAADSDKPASGKSTAAAEGPVEEAKNDKPGRYVFVRVEFDKKYLGEEPAVPVEPEMPAPLKEADSNKAPEAKEPPQSEPKADDSPEQAREQYEAARRQYEADKTASDEFEQKVQDGQKKAQELNERFAAWYYVIPGDSFEKMRLARADLVKPKSASTTPGAIDESLLKPVPDLSLPEPSPPQAAPAPEPQEKPGTPEKPDAAAD